MSAALEGKAVLLTGASSGVGWETALAFARAGARVALVARRAEKLAELAAQADRLGGRAFAVTGDVCDLAGAAGLLARAEAQVGPLDVLVNNAGVVTFTRFLDQRLEDAERIMRTNYLGPAALMQAALPGMLARGAGHVINVASIAGLFGMPFMAAYTASKFALVGLTEALRREHYGSGVAFTAFCPGSVDTPMTAEVLADADVRRLSRPRTPAQIASRIVECCRTRPAEVVVGEAPGALVHAARLAPAFVDWAVHRTIGRVHPAAKKISEK